MSTYSENDKKNEMPKSESTITDIILEMAKSLLIMTKF